MIAGLTFLALSASGRKVEDEPYWADLGNHITLTNKGDWRNITFSLAENKETLYMTLVFPIQTWFGIGFGFQMMNTDLIQIYEEKPGIEGTNLLINDMWGAEAPDLEAGISGMIADEAMNPAG